MKRKVGIMTWHYYYNVGSELQTFALQKVLFDLGYDAFVINYHNPKFGKQSKIKDRVKILLNKVCPFNKKIVLYSHIGFQYKYYHLTKIIYSSKDLEKICDNMYAVIYGSDQIWAPNVFNPIYMGEGLENSKVLKISYAASIGLKTLPNNLVNEYKNRLSSFSNISVRECEAQTLLMNECKVYSSVVLDPTLLLNVDEYKKIQKKVRYDESYIFCYFLNKEHEYRNIVQNFALEKGLRIIGVSVNDNDDEWMHNFKTLDPRLFLSVIEQAEYVFTDSYHGTIFSILFHKNFYTFERFKQDDPVNQNSRIYQLIKCFDIGRRIIQTDQNSIMDSEIDYQKIDVILERERRRSIKYLRESLE